MREVVQAPKVIRDTDYFGVGVPGLVPPSEGTGTKFLRDDGTWQVPAGGGGGGTWGGITGTLSDQADLQAELDDKQDASENLAAVAGAATAANRMIYWTDTGVAAVTSLSAFARTLIDDADASAARSTLGAAAAADIVSDHGALAGLADDDHTQYHNDTRGDARYYTKGQVDTSLAGKQNLAVALSAIGALTPAADRLAYFTGATTAALATLTSFIRTLLDDADASTARGTLGAQAASALLSAIAGLSPAANKLTYWTGASTASLTDLTALARTFLAAADQAAARAAIGAAASGDIPTVPEGALYRWVGMHATAGSNVSGSSVPESPRFMANSYGNVKLADLQGCTEVRLSALVMTAAASGSSPRLLAKYATSFSTSYASWSNLGASAAEVPMSLSATGLATSGWVAMNASAAIETCFLGIGEGGGDDSTSYVVRSVWLEFR